MIAARFRALLKSGSLAPRLAADEELSPIERWNKSINSTRRYRRLCWTRRTTESARQCSPQEILQYILPGLAKLARDRDNEIRGNVALQLGELCEVLATRKFPITEDTELLEDEDDDPPLAQDLANGARPGGEAPRSSGPQQPSPGAAASNTPAAEASGKKVSSPPGKMSAAAAAAAKQERAAQLAAAAVLDANGRNRIEKRMYDQIRRQCAPILRGLITQHVPGGVGITNNGAIRRAAAESLIRMADSLEPDDIGRVVLKQIISLALDDNPGNACIAAHLLARLSAKLPQLLVSRFILPQFRQLADHSLPGVRLCAAAQFGSLASVIRNRRTLRERLLPSFRELCADPMPAVRQACVYAFVEVVQAIGGHERAAPTSSFQDDEEEDDEPAADTAASSASLAATAGGTPAASPSSSASPPATAEAKETEKESEKPSSGSATSSTVPGAGQLGHHTSVYSEQTLRDRAELGISLFQAFSQDEDLLVRTAALQELGKLIWVLGPDCTPLWLVRRYCETPLLPETEFADGDSQRLTWLHCAWTFPAVVQTLLRRSTAVSAAASSSNESAPAEAPSLAARDAMGSDLGRFVSPEHALPPRPVSADDSEDAAVAHEARVQEAPAQQQQQPDEVQLWKELLLPCLRQLLAPGSPEAVRRSVACALHELAQVLGPAVCAEDLLPVALQLARDSDSTVRNCLFDRQHLFLQACDPGSRLQYFRLLERLAENSAQDSSWQQRLALASQLPDLMLHCYAPLHTVTRLARIVLHLSRDPVAEVRTVAAPAVALLVRLAIRLDEELSQRHAELQEAIAKYRELHPEPASVDADAAEPDEDGGINTEGTDGSPQLQARSDSPSLVLGEAERELSQLLDLDGPSERLGADGQSLLRERANPSLADPQFAPLLEPKAQAEAQERLLADLQRALAAEPASAPVIRFDPSLAWVRAPVRVLQPILTAVVQMASARHFRERQQFILICRQLLDVLPVDAYVEQLLPELMRLATDPVANVRLLLASLAKELGRHESFIRVVLVMQLRGELVNDIDADVADAGCVRAADIVPADVTPWVSRPPGSSSASSSESGLPQQAADEGSPEWLRRHRRSLTTGSTSRWDALRQRRRRDSMLQRLEQQQKQQQQEGMFVGSGDEASGQAFPGGDFGASSGAAASYADLHYEVGMSVSRAPDVEWTEQLSASPVPRSFPWEAMSRVEGLGNRLTVRVGLATLLLQQQQQQQQESMFAVSDDPMDLSDDDEDEQDDDDDGGDEADEGDEPPEAAAARPQGAQGESRLPPGLVTLSQRQRRSLQAGGGNEALQQLAAAQDSLQRAARRLSASAGMNPNGQASSPAGAVGPPPLVPGKRRKHKKGKNGSNPRTSEAHPLGAGGSGGVGQDERKLEGGGEPGMGGVNEDLQRLRLATAEACEDSPTGSHPLSPPLSRTLAHQLDGLDGLLEDDMGLAREPAPLMASEEPRRSPDVIDDADLSDEEVQAVLSNLGEDDLHQLRP